MNLDLLLSFVQAPQKMADHPVSDLEGMVADYPYFSAAQMLLLKQYKLQNSSKFNKQLRHAAGVLPDRKQLYRLIEMWPEELEQVLAEDAAVEVVPVLVDKAEEGPIAAETQTMLAEPKELGAPLSEVPLTQLEEVQIFGREAETELPEARVVEESDVIEEVTVEEAVEPSTSDVESLETSLTAMEDESVLDRVKEEVEAAEEEAVAKEELSTAEVVAEPALAILELDPIAEEIAADSDRVALETEKIEEPLSETPEPATVEMQNVEARPPLEEWPLLDSEADKVEKTEQMESVAWQSTELPAQEEPAKADASSEKAVAKPSAPISVVSSTEEEEVAAFITKSHDRLSWFKFFAGKPLREQSDEVLDQLYQEHMQQDLLRAPEKDQQISAIRAQINRDEEVPSSKALEEEIRRLAYESISDDELPASETLAGIYAAQHDYKKAIRIYQKLILKFPDKMSYFARLIEELRAKS